ncbi:MAG: hypothetical protein NVV68_11335 [Dokdonella sp.]|nr:hypothetical protein [Dokdonella sp.]
MVGRDVRAQRHRDQIEIVVVGPDRAAVVGAAAPQRQPAQRDRARVAALPLHAEQARGAVAVDREHAGTGAPYVHAAADADLAAEHDRAGEAGLELDQMRLAGAGVGLGDRLAQAARTAVGQGGDRERRGARRRSGGQQGGQQGGSGRYHAGTPLQVALWT